MEYAIKVKGPDGKFVTLGNVKPGRNGGWQVGIKATTEVGKLLSALAANNGEWVNVSIFESDPNRPKPGYSRNDDTPPW